MKKTNAKKRVNPMARKLVRQPRPKVAFDGNELRAMQVFAAETTAVNVAAHTFFVDCSNTSTATLPYRLDSIIGQLNGVASFYSEYKYTSLKMEWLPSISPGVADGGSRMYIGYLDNPEVINQLSTSNSLGATIDAKGLKNMKFFNAWERFTYNVPLTHRHKWFNVNTVTIHSNTDENDRSTQGAVISGSESISAIATLGTWRSVYTIQLRNLSTQTIT